MSKLQEYIQKYADIYNGDRSMLRRNQDTGEQSLINSKTSAAFFSGDQGTKHLRKYIERFIAATNRAVSILDYGCGQGRHMYEKTVLLNNKTTHEYYRGMIQSYYLYDPCYAKYSEKPSTGSLFDITICTDVMEHVPEEHVDEVLQELSVYTKEDGIVMLTISGKTAMNSFEDGENMHCTVKDVSWWIEKCEKNISHSILMIYKRGDGSGRIYLNTKKFKMDI